MITNNQDKVSKLTLLILLAGISALFFAMIRQFIMTLFIAGLFTALAYPLYSWFKKVTKNREGLASALTLVVIILAILLPLGGLIAIVTAQAIKAGETAIPWIQENASHTSQINEWMKDLPYYQEIIPYKDEILKKAGDILNAISKLIVDGATNLTKSTAKFAFMLLILVYSMFFLFISGKELIDRILYYLPLKKEEEEVLLEKFTSVTRATIKGTFVIGFLQGALAGIAFAVVGIDSAVFWGALMAVLSAIPGIGAPLIWVPAAIILGINGDWGKAIGLFVFCGAIVGSIDNFLRPILVGKDIKMHELMIFFSTLGGLFMFGPIGFIIGPIIAALFVSLWEIYGEVFKKFLVPNNQDNASDLPKE
ncbi:AI-2E family transporter [Limibacter armeniacum]|uniref:AI-2E family transporter n=1 Tax=Limibacter armeniacum TaxID=466084 RepID=UPI002FE5AE48